MTALQARRVGARRCRAASRGARRRVKRCFSRMPVDAPLTGAARVGSGAGAAPPRAPRGRRARRRRSIGRGDRTRRPGPWSPSATTRPDWSSAQRARARRRPSSRWRPPPATVAPATGRSASVACIAVGRRRDGPDDPDGELRAALDRGRDVAQRQRRRSVVDPLAVGRDVDEHQHLVAVGHVVVADAVAALVARARVEPLGPVVRPGVVVRLARRAWSRSRRAARSQSPPSAASSAAPALLPSQCAGVPGDGAAPRA